MTIEENIKLMEDRLNKLERSEKENYEVCRKIRRNIRNLRKKNKEVIFGEIVS